jgi:acyl-CoA hydrolase
MGGRLGRIQVESLAVTTFLTPDEAAARLEPTDTLGLGLATGHPPAFLEALGRRTDWDELRVSGAFLAAFTELFSHPNVHYLSSFFGPLERILRDSGANIGFAPADYRRFTRMLHDLHPRAVATAASRPDADGWCSLSLHAGHTVEDLHHAGADPDRLLVVEAGAGFPRTRGLPPEHRHAIHVDEIDILVESDAAPLPLPEVAQSEVDDAIAANVVDLIPDGATLQTGIGAIPTAIATFLAKGDGGDYGVHSEMFTNGLMLLHQAGKVTNMKGQFDGVSVCTFAGGSTELYEWLDGNDEVAFLPVEVVNSPATIRHNRSMVTINGAMAIDIHGQVVADTIDGRQYSGIGGHEDFVSGPALSFDARSVLCLSSTVTVGGELRSRIVPWFGAGTVITTPRHQVDTVVTEYGAAELMGKTAHQRGEALAAIAHPDFRDELYEAAARASGGNSPMG